MNPDTVGINVVTHYDQIINSGKFQQMDYGEERNKDLYGIPKPPLYQLSNINVPITLFVGLNDWLATKQVFSPSFIFESTSYSSNQLIYLLTNK